MWIRFADILQPTQYREMVGPLKLDFGLHYELEVEAMEFVLDVIPMDEGHRLVGTFPYRATLPCARCLRRVPLSGESHFDLLYRPSHMAPIVVEEELDVFSQSAQVIYYDEDKIPVEDLVTQQMFLEIPDKVLCKDDCKGLCPRCGAELNHGPCGCPAEDDSRWAELAQFVRKEKES
jgi:uncharacterized protein